MNKAARDEKKVARSKVDALQELPRADAVGRAGTALSNFPIKRSVDFPTLHACGLKDEDVLEIVVRRESSSPRIREIEVG